MPPSASTIRTSSVTRRLRGETASSVRGFAVGVGSPRTCGARVFGAADRFACALEFAFALGFTLAATGRRTGVRVLFPRVVVPAARAVGRFATGLLRRAGCFAPARRLVDAADVFDFVVRFAAGARPFALPVARVRGLPATAPEGPVRLPA